MRNKLLKFILLIIAGAAVFIACRKELMEAVDSDSLTIEQAKAWYEAKNLGFLTLKSANTTSGKKTVEAIPNWDDAQKGNDDVYDYVETHLKSSNNFILMNDQTLQDWESIRKDGMHASLIHLVIRQNKKNKATESFVMSMIPDKDWLINNPKRLKQAGYYDLPKDYSGMVFYNDLTGNFVNGWKYTRGKVTHKVTQSSEGTTVKLKSAFCTTYQINILWGNCYTDYSGEIIYYCVSYWYESAGFYTVCYDTSSGGGYDPSKTLNSTLSSIFTNGGTNLSEDDLKALNTAFEKMNEDCMINSITEYLKDNSISLNSISINSQQVQPARYNGIGDMIFAGNWAITPEFLSHEWFHVGQKKMSGTNLTDGYAEFENWLFWDIKETIRLNGNFNIYTSHQFACYRDGMTDYMVEYQNWLKLLTNNGTTYPTLSQVRTMGFYRYGPIFAKDVRSYYDFLNFSTDNSYIPKTMNTLFNNCK